MLLVAAETINRTCIATLLYLIANVSLHHFLTITQGWDTMRFYFEPDEATRVAKCLGLAYISHSAFFVTVDAASMHFVLRVSKLYIVDKIFHRSSSHSSTLYSCFTSARAHVPT